MLCLKMLERKKGDNWTAWCLGEIEAVLLSGMYHHYLFINTCYNNYYDMIPA